MSVSAMYFSKDSVDINTAINFLKNNYKEVRTDLSVVKIKDMDTVSGRVVVTLSNGNMLSFFCYCPGFDVNPENENIPVKNIAGYSWSLSGNEDDESISILTDIAKEFGGYIQKADSDFDGRDNKWHYITGKNSSNGTLEGKIFNMLQDYMLKNVINGAANLNFMVGFISENLDQIKKL